MAASRPRLRTTARRTRGALTSALLFLGGIGVPATAAAQDPEDSRAPVEAPTGEVPNLPPADPGARAPLTPRLRSALDGMRDDDRVPILIEFEASPPARGATVPMLQRRARLSLAPLDAALEAVAVDSAGAAPDIEIVERFWVVPAASARAGRAAIEALADQPGVRRIYLDERFPVPLEPVLTSSQLAFTTDAMRTIGAPAVWPQGVTGQGTVVAIFDTGVDGDNALLASRWRGRRTGIRASWFDPFLRSSLPEDDVGHGTLVASAAVGALPAGDTLLIGDEVIVAAGPTEIVTGTAPEAEWIAARIFQNFGGTAYSRLSVILQAFQWALDPDGDGQGGDAPDVISNSWGTFAAPGGIGQCEGVLYDAIDAAEAAGIAVVFAAGNSGPSAGSVSIPAVRDDPDLRTFAVGATAGTGDAISVADFSGRGPSPCGGGVKPEIVAPGTIPVLDAVRADVVRLTGFVAQGTSFSTPQVAGALALLRQLDPGAPPEEMKRALLATADDLPPPGPDNDAGAGLLDVPAAVILAAPSVVSAGLWQLGGADIENEALVLAVANRGRAGTRPARLRVEAARLTAREVALPGLAPGESRKLEFALSARELRDPPSAVRVTLYAAGVAKRVSRTLFLAPPNPFGGFVLDAGALRVGANDFGRIGLIAATRGFEWRDTELLPAGAFFVAGTNAISDGIYVTVQGRPALKDQPPAADTDWAPRRAFTDADSTGAVFRFDDFEALAPLGLQVDARLDVSEEDGVAAAVLTTSLRNTGPAPLSALAPGVFADWDLAGGERVRWAPEHAALVAEPRDGGGPVTLLAADTTALAMADVPLGTTAPGGFYESGSGVLAAATFPEQLKLDIARGVPVAGGLPGADTATDRAALLSVGPLPLASGQERVLRFFLLAADDEDAAAARLGELRAQPVRPPTIGGAEFTALPPFPNPLRVGEGAIRFPVALSGAIAAGSGPLLFEIYDLAGRRLVQERFPVTPGTAPPLPTWDGRLSDGEAAAAGVYLFVFRLGDEVRSGKVLLLR